MIRVYGLFENGVYVKLNKFLDTIMVKCPYMKRWWRRHSWSWWGQSQFYISIVVVVIITTIIRDCRCFAYRRPTHKQTHQNR